MVREVEIWHPFNGVWLHFSQVTEDGIRKYYTDGNLVATREINEDGTIKKTQDDELWANIQKESVKKQALFLLKD
jgi:hypothetical protein